MSDYERLTALPAREIWERVDEILTTRGELARTHEGHHERTYSGREGTVAVEVHRHGPTAVVTIRYDNGALPGVKRLERAAHRIKLLSGEVEDYYGHFRVTTDLIELRNLLQCADLIVQSALKRHESRGLHFTLDYPDTDLVARDTVLVP